MLNSKLLPEKRRNEILNLIKENKFIKVDELIDKFNISRATINRDLTILEKNGIISKTYGGVFFSDKKDIYSFNTSLSTEINEKKAIANYAIKLIDDNDTITLNTGVTTYEIARLIIEKNIKATIITNSLKIVDLFAANNHTNILSLGGNLYIEGYGFQGKITSQNMNMVQGSIAFIGIHGIDLNEGLTLPWYHEAELVSIMMNRCKKTIILAEYTKFGRLSAYRVEHSLKEINTIITDSKTDKKYIAGLRKMGIEVLICNSSN